MKDGVFHNDTIPARILIVDDEPPNRKLMAGLVRWLGHEPLLAEGGGEALALLEKEVADLVLLDLMMPDIDGLTVLDELRRRGLLPDLPVIVVTALEDQEKRLEALSRGAMDFLTKPLNRHELACRVQNLLCVKRAQDALKTRQEELETAVARRTGQYRALLETAPDLIFLLSMDGTVQYRNRAPGYDCPAVGNTIFDLVAAAGHPQALDMLQRSFESQSVLDFYFEGEPIACRTRCYQGRMRRLPTPESGEPRVLLFATDVTEHRELEQSLAQKQKMEALGQLAGGVAHDFNNLLTAIMSHASFLLDSLPDSDERREDAEGVIHSAERAAGLTRQLLAFSRRQPVKLRPLDLNRNVKEIEILLERTLGGGIALVLHTTPDPAVILADSTKIDQVLLNLAVNARDAMPDGGILSILVDRVPSDSADHEAWIQLSVSDTGLGMEESVRKAVFLPFFSTKAPGKGTGLGLATCYGIVKQLGGEILVQSQPGQGTTFTIQLPSHPAENLREDIALESGEWEHSAGATILLVEDEKPIRETSRRVLEGAGYRVLAAEDGVAALHLMEKHAKELNLVLSDIVLPVGNGYDVVNRAVQLAPQTAVLLTSGWVEHIPDSEAPGPAARTEVIPKPFTNKELLEAVKRTLAAAAKRERPPTETKPQEHRILVVDDEPAIRSLLQRALTKKGYPVVTADGVAAARLVLKDDLAFSAVLCDQNLGDGLGSDLLQWLADHDPHLARRAILLTGEDGAGASHSVDFLEGRIIGKPFQMADLLHRIGTLVC